jgi:peptide deformylase
VRPTAPLDVALTTPNLVLFKDKPEILRQVSTEVLEFGSALDHVVDDLTYVMRSMEKAIGIAAVQIGVASRMGILELNWGNKSLGKPFVMINPVVLASGGITVKDESCLSFPGMLVKKRRSDLVRIRCQDVNGITQERMFRGIWARCILHEIDHMNGKLIIDN